MKAVQLMFNDLLPEDLRDHKRVLDAKAIGKLLSVVAERYPDRYARIANGISDLGRNASYTQGETLTLNDLRPTFDREKEFQAMDAEILAAKKTAKTPEAFELAREGVWERWSKKLEKMTSDTAMAAGNNLAYAVTSGARGKSQQLQAMLTTPGVYADYKGRVIPVFTRHSFSEGLRPAEFLAGTFGARQSVISTKSATARGGDFGKQSAQVVSNLVVTSKDCGTSNGIDLPGDDPSLRGRTLAQETAGFPAGTVIDRLVLAKLSKLKEPVIVRSALTCSAEHGICAHCAGARMNGMLPRIGEHVGVAAAQAISEPVTQGALSAKHTAGMHSGKKTYSGFGVINQLVQSPEVFPDRAEVATTAGKIDRIETAPQGGSFIYVGDTQHYAPAGYAPTVKPGDSVEPGDALSEGIVDPSDIVRHRGLGEGRRYYSQRLKQALDDSGLHANLRNTEMMARGAIDHVVIDDPEGVGEFLPDDTVSYNRIAQMAPPPDKTKRMQIGKQVAGLYLQAPALHYTIGTQLTPKMLDRMTAAGIKEVHAAAEPPRFYPEMVRLRTASHSSPDWLARMGTSYLKTNLAESAARGADTNTESNTSWIPRLAIGKDFGKNVGTTGKF
jgi:DNA-directed RNA polymerase subunit beta'